LKERFDLLKLKIVNAVHCLAVPTDNLQVKILRMSVYSNQLLSETSVGDMEMSLKGIGWWKQANILF